VSTPTPDAPGLLDPLFTTERMRALTSDRALVQGMLDFEAGLARALARAGIAPAAEAEAVAAACRAEDYDPAALGRAAALAGNPAIPLVKALTERVGAAHPGAARWVHHGATSQDAMDTALALQLRGALDAFDEGLARLAAGLARLAAGHRDTLLAGRTLLQQAAPVTLGLKVAGWLDAVERHRERLREARRRALVVQLGGPVGTLAAYGAAGLELPGHLAAELGLAAPAMPWHAHRDRPAEVATVLGLLVGTLGKIARDVALLMQTEVAEAFEPDAPGRGGSSSMPQKRNPVSAAVVGAAALRAPALVATLLGAMVQEQERGLGGWHAEWEALPELLRVADGALAQVAVVVEGLEVDAGRMAENLAASGGQLLAGAAAAALAPRLGRAAAHAAVERASRRARAERRSLAEALAAEPAVQGELSRAELERLLDPRAAAGAAPALVDRVLAAAGEARASKKDG
jgi:3-carboxy-cis,cis-muconate cycloisomerase